MRRHCDEVMAALRPIGQLRAEYRPEIQERREDSQTAVGIMSGQRTAISSIQVHITTGGATHHVPGRGLLLFESSGAHRRGRGGCARPACRDSVRSRHADGARSEGGFAESLLTRLYSDRLAALLAPLLLGLALRFWPSGCSARRPAAALRRGAGSRPSAFWWIERDRAVSGGSSNYYSGRKQRWRP